MENVDNNKKVYDLEVRTAKFGGEIIIFSKQVPKNVINNPLINQLVRSGTSIGANYCEADCAESRKDFEHKIGICKKEAKEVKHWLKMMLVATPEFVDKIKDLINEAHQLQSIFIKIVTSSKNNSKN